MELVKGGSLESKRHRFGDVAWARGVLRDTARGLVALHAAGVVHRDLKPANVLLDEDGTAKLSDFGIARFGGVIQASIDPEAPTDSASRTGSSPRSGLTRTGAWLGTPFYMAPEAVRGDRDSGAAIDVFAFGIVAYEVLTGRAPHSMPPVLLALAEQSLPEPPPLPPEIAPPLRDALRACLSEDPSHRPDASRLLAALEA